jgi:hypothetical protein
MNTRMYSLESLRRDQQRSAITEATLGITVVRTTNNIAHEQDFF